MNRKHFLVILLPLILMHLCCKKFLDTKSDQSLATPTSLEDLEALLNNIENTKGTVLLNGMSDEYYFTPDDLMTLLELQQDGYKWDAETNDNLDWSIQYNKVFLANTVLFNLNRIPERGNDQRRNKVKAQAQFLRSLAFYRLAQLFAPQYDPATSNTDLGIPLRLSADITELSTRSTVQQTYDQILGDLNQALQDLPTFPPINSVNKTQPTKAAAYGLLARIYLQIGNYSKAKENAEACLAIHDVLMDFNDINWVDPSSSDPFKLLNPEVIFHSLTDAAPNTNDFARVDSILYLSYDNNDIRSEVYFSDNGDNTYRFKGSYTTSGSYELFCGIATDEMYLIRAECQARLGNASEAMTALNDLLRTRWKSVNGITTYVDQSAPNATEALVKVLVERKKELVYRELRWPDLRRLNKEPAFAKPLRRDLNGTIMLPPNDLRYTLLIPEEVMRVANIPQNPR